MPKKKQLNNVGTVYDNVFRTECEHMKPLLIPVINELFQTNYTMKDTGVLRLANEHLLRDHDTEEDEMKRITDSLLKIGDTLYHVECQSTGDGSILIRLVDYNLRIGFENAYHDRKKRHLRIDLPMSALLMLGKGGKNKMTHMKVEYTHEGKSLEIEIPVMHVQAYTMEEIFEKELYFLIPFYTMRFKREIREIAKDKENSLESRDKYDKIISEMKVFAERLREACEDKKLSEDYTRELAAFYVEIMNATAIGLDNEKREGMVNTMGGKILKLKAEVWMEEGRKEGMEQEKVNTDREKKRADEAELECDEVKAKLSNKETELSSAIVRIRELEEENARLRAAN